MPLRIDILTLFPEMFASFLGTSIPKRAAEKGLVQYRLINIRDFATDAHQSVDDKPFGGGPGMVMLIWLFLCSRWNTAWSFGTSGSVVSMAVTTTVSSSVPPRLMTMMEPTPICQATGAGFGGL